MRTKVLLRAPILSNSGYGHDARLLLRALYDMPNVELFVHATPWGQTSWSCEDTIERALIDQLIIKYNAHTMRQGTYDVSVQNTIPGEFQRLAPFNIGVTAACETNKMSAEWVSRCDLMDHIIVHSKFTKDVVLGSSYKKLKQDQNVALDDSYYKELEPDRVGTPVSIVNFPAHLTEAADVDFSELNQTENNFLVCAQWGPRKNVINTIAWFLQEFKNDGNVGLILKLNTINDSLIDRHHTARTLRALLARFPNHLCKVYLMHGRLKLAEMSALYQHPTVKAFIANSHGEGTGLPELEAASYGVPIITSAWSGRTDFLYYPDDKGKLTAGFCKVEFDLGNIQQEAVWPGVLEAGTMWCFPKEASFKKKMRSMLNNHGSFKKKAEKLREYVLATFTQDAMMKDYRKIFKNFLVTPDQAVVDWLKDISAAQED